MTFTLKEISQEVEKQKKLGKKVGLITGCFDVLHFGHIQFIRAAKKQVDYLVVGLDNDRSISLTKGENQPINPLEYRMEVLSELRSVDAVFDIVEVFDFHNKSKAERALREITQKISPDYLITNINADDYWKEKKERAKHLKIKFFPLRQKRPASSTAIIEKLTK